mgnify:CR=1 FL=1
MSHDESLHVFYSWTLSEGRGFAHTPMMHGPFLFEATALLQAIFGANDFTSRLLPAIIGSAIVIVIPLLLRPWIGRVGALSTALLLSASPYLLYYSRYNRHDILVIAWALLAFFAILSYERIRRERDLVILSVSLALMFASMEITFMYLAIFVAFLFIAMIARSGLHWRVIRQSAEFDLLIVLATLGAFFSSPIAILGLNPIWQAASGKPFVDLAVLGSFGMEWAGSEYGIRLWGLLGGFSLAAIALGWWWGKMRWVKLAGIFLAITLPLFSTFFTNPTGLGTGLIGSLGYWLSQQAVQRGSQPWFYYGIVFPFYEFFPILLGLAAVIFFTLRRKRFDPRTTFFILFIFFWAILIGFALSIAGEKMPWLSTHLAVPWILLAGWGIEQFFITFEISKHSRVGQTVRWISGGIALVLLMVSLRTSLRVNFVTYDYTTEVIGYAHGAPGAKWAAEDIQRIAAQSGKGNDLVVAYDSQISWPMSWYFREFKGFFGEKINPGAVENADVVVVGSDNFQKADLFLGAGFQRYEVIRMWWPIEDYKNLTMPKIQADLSNPAMRSALWQIFWNRDYSAYAALTGQPNIAPPQQWPLEERMRVYIRSELALQIPPQKLAGSQLESLTASADAYRDLPSSDQAAETLTNLDLNAPRNLAIGQNGDLFVVDTGQSRILKLDAQGKQLAVFGSRTPEEQVPPAPGTFNEPWGIALDEDGFIYVADTWNHRIQKFDPTGNFVLEWGNAGVSAEGSMNFWGPRGVAVAGNRVYVTDTGNRRVAVFSTGGQFLLDFDQGGEAALDEPVGLAVHEQHVYVADTWNQRVAVFSTAGQFLSSWPVETWGSASLDNKPYLAVSPEGDVFISDPEGFRVIEFSPDGKPLAVLGISQEMNETLILPNGIALDRQGRVWIVDSGNARILAYSINP